MSDVVSRTAQEVKTVLGPVSRINWESVEEEYRRRAVAKSRSKRPFACRSAEGAVMYKHLGSHNGNMRQLAEVGQRALMKRVQLEQRERAKRKA